uniref:Uncharacterized protein n=1 Tax=Ralstonia solanacearum TaxID=305 RepID=A0A0S4WEA4_RALSL|nr:protein of unknown function [Ralstonia solanacearum]
MRSPGTGEVTPAPHDSTVPTISWPGMSEGLGLGGSPSTMCKSVRHTPQADTAIRTLPGPGTGMGMFRNFNGARTPSRTMACIESDIEASEREVRLQYGRAARGDRLRERANNCDRSMEARRY